MSFGVGYFCGCVAKMQQIKLDIRPFLWYKAKRKCRVQASVERCAKFCASKYKVALSLVAAAISGTTIQLT